MTYPNGNTPAAAVKFNRSQLFSVYNKARAAARQGKLDEGRVNRALGILQSNTGADRISKYQATGRGCSCPDSQHGHTCKHRIALWIAKRAGELLASKTQVSQ